MPITPEQITAIAERHLDPVYSNSLKVRQAVLENVIREALMIDRQVPAPVQVYTIDPSKPETLAILEFWKQKQ